MEDEDYKDAKELLLDNIRKVFEVAHIGDFNHNGYNYSAKIIYKKLIFNVLMDIESYLESFALYSIHVEKEDKIPDYIMTHWMDPPTTWDLDRCIKQLHDSEPEDKVKALYKKHSGFINYYRAKKSEKGFEELGFF